MSELQFIEKTLERAARRRRLDRAVRGLCQGLLIGACIWLVAFAIFKVRPITVETLRITAIVAIACVPIGFIVGGWRTNSLSETARWVDGRQKLQERLSTALEISKGSGTEAWRELLVADAVTHVKGVDPRRLVKIHAPRNIRWALLAMALAAGLAFVPEYRSKDFLKQQADQKVIADVGKNLVEIRKTIAPRPAALETTEKSLNALDELGDQMMKKSMTRTEALKNIDSLADKLKDQIKEMQKDPVFKRMEEASRSKGGETSQDPAQLQKQIDNAQKQLGNSKGSPEQMEKMAKDLAKLQEAAKAAAEKDGGMSQADKEKLAQSMAALSKQAQDMGMKTPELDQAIQALASNQTDMFLKDMEAATTDLQKMSEMAKDMQKAQAQLEKIGKDLAEQLKNGQAQAAQQTLQKMMDQLKNSNLSQEQMAKMMDEVSKAVTPGNKIGKVGEHLSKAASQMGQGQKPGAAQSLAEASKELDKLMQQMNDAQALMAEMDALKQAGQCVGMCQSWGEGACNKPGMGKGGKPGSGVGTWASEDGGWGYDGKQTDRYDNTGMERPDMDSKGHTDRGDAELSDALKPTKVKGQFTPGGNMPSITLKGVSIKGTSTVDLQDAQIAAQAEAQSALSQDKVPRAYQEAVRNYFDDSKK